MAEYEVFALLGDGDIPMAATVAALETRGVDLEVTFQIQIPSTPRLVVSYGKTRLFYSISEAQPIALAVGDWFKIMIHMPELPVASGYKRWLPEV